MKNNLLGSGLIVLVWLGLAFAIAACSTPTPRPVPTPAATEPSRITPLPQPTATFAAAADGDTLMRARCTTCHTLERVLSSKKTRAQWSETVNRMVRLSAPEEPTLLDYLAKNYGS